VQRLVCGGSPEDCRPLVAALVETHPEFCFDPYPGRASGYIVDTVQTVLHFFLGTDSFDGCVVGVVNQGDDADTTGALAGMLAGAAYGVSAIPARWLKSLDTEVVRHIERQTDALLGIASKHGQPVGWVPPTGT
jgi:ADP-ribosyl-[dinitrogen reductase] hydrolase